jgi:hypothetical protein
MMQRVPHLAAAMTKAPLIRGPSTVFQGKADELGYLLILRCFAGEDNAGAFECLAHLLDQQPMKLR